MKPIAYINVEKRTLEFAKNIFWHTPTVANLDRIPLFTKEALAKEKTLQALHDENERLGLYKDAYTQTEKEPVAWRELCRRLYVELFHCDQQMMAALDEEGNPMWQQGATVRDVLADAKTALETSPPQPEQEPKAWRTFDGEGGYDYRSYEDNESYADDWDKRNPNHKGWVDKLYTHSQRTWVGLTDEDKKQMAKEANYHWEMTAGEYAERIGQLTEAKLKERNT